MWSNESELLWLLRLLFLLLLQFTVDALRAQMSAIRRLQWAMSGQTKNPSRIQNWLSVLCSEAFGPQWYEQHLKMDEFWQNWNFDPFIMCVHSHMRWSVLPEIPISFQINNLITLVCLCTCACEFWGENWTDQLVCAALHLIYTQTNKRANVEQNEQFLRTANALHSFMHSFYLFQYGLCVCVWVFVRAHSTEMGFMVIKCRPNDLPNGNIAAANSSQLIYGRLLRLGLLDLPACPFACSSTTVCKRACNEQHNADTFHSAIFFPFIW